VLDELRYSLLEKQIEVHLPDTLPTITAEAKGMHTVLSNLLSNAVKYIGEATAPRVEIGYAARERFHEFWVRDNGIGIDPQDHQKVFELFQRVQPGSSVEGSGVGLTIVKKIVENHRGQVWLDSALGRGTTVYFTIPKVIG